MNLSLIPASYTLMRFDDDKITFIEITKCPSFFRKLCALMATIRAWSGWATSAKIQSTIPAKKFSRTLSLDDCLTGVYFCTLILANTVEVRFTCSRTIFGNTLHWFLWLSMGESNRIMRLMADKAENFPKFMRKLKWFTCKLEGFTWMRPGADPRMVRIGTSPPPFDR